MSAAIRVYQGRFGRVALLDVGRPLVTHAHSQCHVLIKASGADTFFAVRNALQPLTDDTAVLVNAWEPHAYVQPRPDAPRTIFLALYIEPAWLATIEGALRSAGQPGFFPQANAKISPAIKRRANELALQMLHAEQPNEDALESMLCHLIMEIVDTSSNRRDAGIQIMQGFATYDRRIRRAVLYMRSNLGAELNIDRLAHEACLSRAHFFKLFQQCTTLTPHVYANVLRMETAVRELAQTQDPIASVSERLGFSAQGHFTRFFQQHLGVMPSQYRRVVDVYGPNQADQCGMPMRAVD